MRLFYFFPSNPFLILIFLMQTTFHCTFSSIPNDLIPINEYDNFRGTFNSTTFNGGTPRNYTSIQLQSFQGMVKIGDFYYVYGRENIFVISLQDEDANFVDILLEQTVQWKASDADVSLCVRKGQSYDNCKGYIKLFQEDTKRQNTASQIMVCSTNAFNPACRTYQRLKSGLLKLSQENLSGNLLCPHSPIERLASLVADGNLYTASMMGFGGQDALIFRSSRSSSLVNLRTSRADRATLNGRIKSENAAQVCEHKERYSHALTDVATAEGIELLNLGFKVEQLTDFAIRQCDDPEFIRFVDPGDTSQKIFIFFKETAIEDRSYKVYSRVGQACKNDQGGNNFLRNQFSSFFKARLDCSFPGQPNFYFDELSDVSDFVISQTENSSDEKMVFAIMNTPRNSVPASAICAFTIGNIEKAMMGPFMEKHTNTKSGHTYWERTDTYPTPHLANCDRPTRLSHTNLNFIRRHPLMFDRVGSWSNGVRSAPLFTRTSSRNFLTSVAVDVAAGNNLTIIFAGTEDGKILKILLLNSSTMLIEERLVFDEKKCSGDRSVKKIMIDKATSSLLVAFDNCIVRSPLCPLLQSNCARDCVGSRDPYCGWNGTNCVAVDPQQDVSSRNNNEGIEQDIFNGNVDALPNCTLLNMADMNASKHASAPNNASFIQNNDSVTLVAPPAATPDSNPHKNQEDSDSSYLYIIAGVVCLVIGFVVGLLLCGFLNKFRLKKEEHSADYDVHSIPVKRLDERRESYNNRTNSLGSHYVKRNSNPRVSLLIDQKRARTITETSYRSEEGLLVYQADTAQENSNEPNHLHPERARQMTSVGSGGPDKRRARSSRPSVTSDIARNDNASDSPERPPSPLSDTQYEDPFSEETEMVRLRSMENGAVPDMYSVTLPPSNVKMRAPTARSMSFQGGPSIPMNRTYSMGNAGSYTLDITQAQSRTPNRKFSLQVPPSGLHNPPFQPHLVQQPVAPAPAKPYSMVNQYQAEPAVVYDKNPEVGRVTTEYTHSLDRRRRRPKGVNGQVNFSESFDEYRHPLHGQNAYPARKRIMSESEKAARTPTSRPPRHHAINEEEEIALAHQKKRNSHGKFSRNHLKLEIPKHNHLFPNHQMGQSPPILEHPNAPFHGKSNFSKRLLDHSSPVTPIRDFNYLEQESLRRFAASQQRSMPETNCEPLSHESTPFLPHSSSPRTDGFPPNFASLDKIRQFSGNYGSPQQVPSPNRISAPMGLEIDPQRVRHPSSGMPARILRSSIEAPENYRGVASSPRAVTTDKATLIFT